MSHFTTTVVVKDATDPKDAVAKAEAMLAPFDEELEVPREVWFATQADAVSEVCWWRKYGSDRVSDDDRAKYEAEVAEPKDKWRNLPNGGAALNPQWGTWLKNLIKSHNGRPVTRRADNGEQIQFGYIDTYNSERQVLVLCSGANGSEADQPSGNEVLRQMLTDQAGRRVRQGEQGSGRPVHVLPELREGEEQSSDSGAALEVVAGSEVRGDTGVVRGADGSTGEPLRNLSVHSGRVTGDDAPGEDADAVHGGPLPRDGQTEGTALSELQLDAWVGQGPHRSSHCGNPVPHAPHVTGTETFAGAKWDWFKLGGRWQGYWPVKPGTDPTMWAGGQPGAFGNDKRFEADVIRKGDIDFDFQLRQETIEAEAEFDKWEKVAEGLNPADFTPWSEFRKRVKSKDLEIEEARSAYASQEIIRRIRSRENMDLFGWLDGPEEFFWGQENARERYVSEKRAGAFATFALLDEDGWHEKGAMGWFGMVADEKDTRSWAETYQAVIDALPDDAWLMNFDLHI